MRRPTLADVAHRAGVSKTTASLALNDKGRGSIPESTRQRVLEAARTLRFRPHGLARALTRRRADVMGIVCRISPFIERSHHAFEHGILSTIFCRALQHGYNPMIYGLPEGEEEHELSRFADGRSDGFILINPPLDNPLQAYLEHARIPAVMVCRRSGDLWVDSDHEGGIAAIVNHLSDLGHRRIAYLTGPPGEENCRARVAAFRSCMSAVGLPVREDWIAPFRWSSNNAREQLELFVRGPAPVTAVLAWNDFVAEEVYRAARVMELRIPEDLSVVGFDDTPSAPITSPGLTTVRQDLEGLGSAAVDLLLYALSRETPAESGDPTVFPVSFVERQSTAKPLKGERG